MWDLCLLTWVTIFSRIGNVESRGNKSSSMSDPSFRLRLTVDVKSADYFVSSFPEKEISLRKRDHRSPFTERTDAYHIGLACHFSISSVQYFIRLYIVVLLARRAWRERVPRDTQPQRPGWQQKKEREEETTKTLFYSEPNRRDTVLTNLRALNKRARASNRQWPASRRARRYRSSVDNKKGVFGWAAVCAAALFCIHDTSYIALNTNDFLITLA